jgi:5-methylcytosine-specific restriction endonuclease McrA
MSSGGLYQQHAQRLASRDGGYFCAYCGHRLIPPNALEKYLEGMLLKGFRIGTIDHVKAKSVGGVNHRSNYVLACEECNQLKGIMSEEEFLAHLVSRKQEGQAE